MFHLKGLWWFVFSVYWLSLVPLFIVLKLAGLLNLGWVELLIVVFPLLSTLSVACFLISCLRSKS